MLLSFRLQSGTPEHDGHRRFLGREDLSNYHHTYMSFTALMASSQRFPLRAALTITVTLPCDTLAPRGMPDSAETAVFLT